MHDNKIREYLIILGDDNQYNVEQCPKVNDHILFCYSIVVRSKEGIILKSQSSVTFRTDELRLAMISSLSRPPRIH